MAQSMWPRERSWWLGLRTWLPSCKIVWHMLSTWYHSSDMTKAEGYWTFTPVGLSSLSGDDILGI